jgi:hypothetical protein
MKHNCNHQCRMNILKILYGIQNNINLGHNKSVQSAWIHNLYIWQYVAIISIQDVYINGTTNIKYAQIVIKI